VNAVKLLLELQQQFGCRLHVVHVASKDVLKHVYQARRRSQPVTAETCPHYLFFAAEEVPYGDTRFKCAPPIRGSHDRNLLWYALRTQVLDTIGSDHSPAPPELKHVDSGDLVRAWGGIASLQLSLSAVWTEAARRGCTLEDVVGWMATRPTEIMGLGGRKGAIAPGHDADLVIFDPEAEFVVDPERLYHRHKLTPYAGRSLRGRIDTTYLRGRVVYQHERCEPSPSGQLLRRGSISDARPR
jgi:allantoinase